MSNYTNQYFTTVAQESGEMRLRIPSYTTSSYMTYIAYSTDRGSNWNSTTVTSSNQSIIVSVSSGDTVMWKGVGTRLGYGDTNNIEYNTSFSASTCQYYVEGNIMSLLYGDDFSPATTLTGQYTFRHLFSQSKVTSMKNLIMPFTNVTRFTLANFAVNCTALTESPLLLCETVNTNYAYALAFDGCSNLNKISCLATSFGDSTTFTNWVRNVSASGTFYKNPNATWSTGASGIPSGWEVKDYVPYPETASTFTSDGGNATYSLETQASWNAVSDSNWLIVSPISGTGDETLSITVKKKSDYDSGRTGTVTVTDTNDNILLVWTVEQERKKYLIKLMNLWKNGAPINKLFINDDSRYQSFVNLGACNTIEYTTTGGTMIQVPRTGWGSPLISNAYNDGGVLTFLGQPTAIAPNAFSGSDITTFSVPDSVSAIGANAFAECAEIEEITLGENIASLGAGAFSGCSNLAYIEAQSDTAPSISADTFYGVAEGGTLKHNPGTDYSTWMSDDPYYLGYYGWEEETEIDYSTKYFTIRSLEDNNTISIRTDKNIQMSSNNGTTWVNAGSTTLNSGATLLLKRNDSVNYICATTITASSQYEVYGNLNSLVKGDDFATTGTLPTYVFAKLFSGDTKIVSAEHLILPWSAVSECSFRNAFYYCTNLVAGPELPATTLARSCYGYMFDGCTKLEKVTSALPATTMQPYCYDTMFRGTAITTAPALPATTHTSGCYSQLFTNCLNLTSITCLLSAQPSSIWVTYNWVGGVASTGTFYKNSNATWGRGSNGIPSNWTVVDYSG